MYPFSKVCSLNSLQTTTRFRPTNRAVLILSLHQDKNTTHTSHFTNVSLYQLGMTLSRIKKILLPFIKLLVQIDNRASIVYPPLQNLEAAHQLGFILMFLRTTHKSSVLMIVCTFCKRVNLLCNIYFCLILSCEALERMVVPINKPNFSFSKHAYYAILKKFK